MKIILILILISSISFAQDVVEIGRIQGVPEPTEFLLYSFAATMILIAISFLTKLSSKWKKVIFVIIALSIGLSTIYLGAYTIYLNIISENGGPVHWHADYEVWICGEKLDLINPSGFSNKVGTAILHEHDDDRIHVEGVIIKKIEASLGVYFRIIGGKLTTNELIYPTENRGIVEVKNGENCDGKPAKIQAFLYKTNGNEFTQTKLENFPDYVMSPKALVPPGDCIIIEFDKEKTETEKLCLTYQVDVEKGDLIRG